MDASDRVLVQGVRDTRATLSEWARAAAARARRLAARVVPRGGRTAHRDVGRRGAWHEPLAATFVTVTLAVPVLVIASVVGVYFLPRLLAASAV